MTTGLGRGTGSSAPRSEDVARLAYVSRKTVSRVLNNEPYVSDASRRRVLAAAEELGYRLNHAARALASGRTRSIGVVALGTAGYGTASLLVGIEQAVRDAGYALRVLNTPDGDSESIAAALESLLEQGVDGIVVSEPIVEGEVPLGVDVPVLFLGAPPAFSAARTLTRRRGRPSAGTRGHRSPPGPGASDRPSPRRAAAVVRHHGPHRGMAGGARSPGRARTARTERRLVGGFRVRRGSRAGRRRLGDRRVRRRRRDGHRPDPCPAGSRIAGFRRTSASWVSTETPSSPTSPRR